MIKNINTSEDLTVETVKTRDFGVVQVSESDKIIFKKPIFGFEDLKEFYLIPLEEPKQFTLLQSRENECISFMLTRPKLFLTDYILDIDNNDANLLEISDHNDISDFAIITIPEDMEKITMNILGPIVINMKTKFAVQSISNCIDYTTKCRLFAKQVELA